MSSRKGPSEMKLFVYGTLKPDQPGHRFLQQSALVRSIAERDATMPNFVLRDWDGLPIAMRSDINQHPDHSRVRGYLLDIDTESDQKLLEHLDLYELGKDHMRNLRLESQPVLADENEVVIAYVYVFNEERAESALKVRLGNSPLIPGGNWTMADDWVLTTVLPNAYRYAENLLASSKRDVAHHVKILGTYLVLYSCLERFGLHIYGPRRYKEKDREPLQKRLEEDYFNEHKSLSWFNSIRQRVIFDSDTMTKRELQASPPHFWATVRNNSAHQGKAAVDEYTELLMVATSTLGDFLALALMNIDEICIQDQSRSASLQHVGFRLKNTWADSGFNPKMNALQNLLGGP